jgi:SAM-dependent methyltransferase
MVRLQTMAAGTSTRLNLGCATQVVDGWTNVDYAPGAWLAKVPGFPALNRRLRLLATDWDPRIVLQDLRKPLGWPDASVDVVYTSHTLEHLSHDDGRALLAECARVLRPGGVLRVVVPSFASVASDYATGALPADRVLEAMNVVHRRPRLREFLSLRTGVPHLCMYDDVSLVRALQDNGFEARVRAPFDSDIADIAAIELAERTVGAAIVEGRRAVA